MSREQCEEYRSILTVLDSLLRDIYNAELFDRNLTPTSEGRKVILKIYREMMKSNLKCVRIVREILSDFNKVYKLYECLENELDYCLS